MWLAQRVLYVLAKVINSETRRCNMMRELVRRRDSRTVPRGIFALHGDMDRMFDDLFNGFGLATLVTPRGAAGFAPKVDVAETTTAVKISAELPGMAKKDVKVEVEDEQIIIHGERKEEHKDKDEQENWHHREVSYGSFYRSIPLPAAIDGAKAKATFADGVLKITLPKRKEEEETKRTLTIE